MPLLPHSRFLASLCLSLLALPAAAEVMHCRPDERMALIAAHDVDGAGVPGRTVMGIAFEKAALPAQRAQPQPGECALDGRDFLPDEAPVLWLESHEIEFGFVLHGRRVMSIHVEGHSLNPLAADWQFLIDRVRALEEFAVEVDYRPEAFVVTGVHR